MDTPIRINSRVIFSFRFPHKSELGPRLRFDCYWDTDVHLGTCLHFLSDNGSVSYQVLNIAKEMNWEGSVREYMMWQRYAVNYARKGASQKCYAAA